MGVKLQARYSLIIVALVTVIVASMAGLYWWQIHTSVRELRLHSTNAMLVELRQQLQGKAVSMAELVNANVVNAYLARDLMAMLEVLAPVRADGAVIDVFVFDADNKVVHDGTHTIADYGLDLSPTLPARTLEKNQIDSRVFDQALIVSRPLYARGTYIGGTQVRLSLAPLGAEVQAAGSRFDEIASRKQGEGLLTLALLSALLLAVGLLLAMITSRRLARPITELASYAKRIGDGNYDVDISVRRDDEIGALASAFKDMSRNLATTTRQANFHAHHDSLTQLPNRRQLLNTLARALNGIADRECPGSGALLFIDLDDFKRVNDSLGHSVGDALLEELAGRLIGVLRAAVPGRHADVDDADLPLARWGGDEFAVVLERIESPEEAAQLAQDLLNAIARPFNVVGFELVVGASIGMTVFPDDADNVEELFRYADMAMYQAKESGKNRCLFYTYRMNELGAEKLALEAQLRSAIENREFCLVYQPLYDGHLQEIISVEALIRWNHPERGLLGPDQFLEIAESAGSITEIGEWVIKTAVQDLQRWRDAGAEDLKLSLNISSVQFHTHNIAEHLALALENTSVDSGDVCVEITETQLFRSMDMATAMLRHIKALGVKVWIDDFGTGYSSLNRLRRLPIDGIKIDKSFVRGIIDSEDDRSIVSIIIMMAQSLGLEFAAEGVENQQQFDFLLRRGCSVMQGFYFGQPVTVEEYLERLAATQNDIKALIDS